MSNKHSGAPMTVLRVIAVVTVWLLAASAAPALAADAAAAPAPSSAPAAPQAAVVPTPAAVAAANELMQLQEDTVVLKAQLKKLDAQQQVAEREASLNRMDRSLTNTEVALVATQSLGHETSATVRTADGGDLDVRDGDTLPNGMHVMSIRPGAMVVQSPSGQRVTLIVLPTHGESARLASAAVPHGAIPPIPTLPLPAR